MRHQRTAIVFSAFLLLWILACENQQVPPTAGDPEPSNPVLTIPDTLFNFGFAPQNSIIAHTFWLKSTGNDTLRILRVVPG